MNGVVENVLEMSRRRNPNPERLNLLDTLEGFREDALQTFPDAEISMHSPDSSLMVRIDPSHLNQIVTNLVDNALRYSKLNHAGEKVSLDCGIEAHSQRPYLNVVDYGKGVDEELVPELFQPFSTTSIGGTGLGLYIAKELCEANQAHLSYTRHAEGGSCFRILFTHPDRIIA